MGIKMQYNKWYMDGQNGTEMYKQTINNVYFY